MTKRNGGSGDENDLWTPCFKHLCPEMQAVTKMVDLTKFRQTDVGQSDDFYANYITRDGVNMLANLTNLAIFMQITS